MAIFVLVHGAFHGAWCWTKLAPELAARGHRAVTFDLPGGGDDRAPIEQITLDSYAARVAEEISRQAEPVFLVGHSLGGISISGAAERAPERVRMLVYLCAFILRDGQSLYTLLDPTAPADSVPPKGSSWDIVSSPVPGEAALNIFYNGCPAESIAFARARLRPQAMAPRITPLSLSGERYGRVPRAYIQCTDDQAVSLDLQGRMVANSPCEKVLSLPTGHSPFFAAPGKLADALASLV